jgi:HSP20 family molecular chaperone IbpA
MAKSKLTIPGKVLDVLFSDEDNLIKEIAKNKKIDLPTFPPHNQWRDSEGFCFEFALAGFSPEDVKVSVKDYIINIASAGINQQEDQEKVEDPYSEEFIKNKQQRIQKGYITRGIARRSFSVSYFISSEFDLSKTRCTMQNGLLSIFIPDKSIEQRLDMSIKIN